MTWVKGRKFIERLSSSRIYQDYEQAFSNTTGLPLALRPVETWHLVQHGKKSENPFCALMAQHRRTCAACLEVQEKITKATGEAPRTVNCFAGLCETVVPLHLGNELIGYLQTGQVLLKNPTKKRFARIAIQLAKWGMTADLKQVEEAYFHTRVLTTQQYDSLVRLLTIFGQHLSLVSNQIAIQQQNAEPLPVARAKQFISTRHVDDISLADVARAASTSTFYFCKIFRKATGLNFKDYLSRVRIEKAKNLLLNPNPRVSEVAYASGFQSLTQFNRVFRRVAGQSPTQYRKKLRVSNNIFQNGKSES